MFKHDQQCIRVHQGGLTLSDCIHPISPAICQPSVYCMSSLRAGLEQDTSIIMQSWRKHGNEVFSFVKHYKLFSIQPAEERLNHMNSVKPYKLYKLATAKSPLASDVCDPCFFQTRVRECHWNESKGSLRRIISCVNTKHCGFRALLTDANTLALRWQRTGTYQQTLIVLLVVIRRCIDGRSVVIRPETLGT